jgi:hypothetical protein
MKSKIVPNISMDYFNTNRFEYTPKGRYNSDSLALLSIWAESHKKQIMFCDLPSLSMRNYLAEKEYIVPMADMFKDSCKEVIMDYEIEDLWPYSGAVKLKGDMLLHPSDEYTGAILRKIKSSFDTVLMLSSYGQEKSIASYFQLSDTQMQDCLHPRNTNPFGIKESHQQ